MSFADEYEQRCGVKSDIVDHLPMLFYFARNYPTVQVLELGVRSGNSTAAFLAAAEGVGGHVWSVDIDKPSVPTWWEKTGLWTSIVGNDVDPDVIERVRSVDGFDVLFIDSSHTYDHTLAELRTYVPLVRSGGVVLCHDTELPWPEGADPIPPYPVARALDTYCEEIGCSWTNRNGCSGLGMLYP